MTKKIDLGFTIRKKKDDYILLHNNKVATTLRGTKAQRFESDIQTMTFSEQQQLMARLTGNYKHGNERVSKNHNRHT